MKYAIQTTTNARRDIRQAVDWEEKRSQGLGGRFLTDLNSRFSDIAAVPKMGSLRREKIRSTTTKIFQYYIYYTVDENNLKVIILRVLHIRRKPLDG